MLLCRLLAPGPCLLRLHPAEQGGVRPAADFRAAELRRVGAGQVGVGFEDAEQFRLRSQAHTATRMAETTKCSASFRHGERTPFFLDHWRGSSVPLSLIFKKPEWPSC